MYRKPVVFFSIVLLLWKVTSHSLGDSCDVGNEELGKCASYSDCDDVLIKTIYLEEEQANHLRARIAACSNSTVKMVCCLNVVVKPVAVETTAADIKRYSIVIPKTCGDPPAENSTFGWTVLIGTGHFYRRCVGTLINHAFVLTTADCIHGVKPNEITLFIGNVAVETLPECSLGAESCQTYIAEKFLLHEDFDPIQKQFNVALIKMTGNATFGSQIYPICLPLNATDEDTQLEKRYILRPRITDTTNGIQEACGYSGAPIVVLDNEMRYHVVGVANHPVDCDRKRVKRDATPLMEYVDWIISTLAHS